MKKIFPTLALLIAMLSFTSCAIQQEVDIYKKKEKRTEYFMHKKHTVRDGLFSKNRKLKIRHRYFYRDINGKWHFRPTPINRDFIHYRRTGRVWFSKGKLRVIKRGTVAKPRRSK